MKAQSKHRLIGSLVLLAVLAVFLPLLFHHPHPELQAQVSSSIPTPPAMQDIKLQLAKTAKASKKLTSKKPSGEISKISATLLKTPKAWTLQVATFSNQKNAQHLLQTLRNKGFDAYTKAVKLNNKTYTKVYVGPQIDQGRLKDLQRKLKKQYRLNGVIAKYSA